MAVKRHIQSFLAFGLSALILLSAGGFSMDLHYCQGHLKSIAFFGKAKNCHEAVASHVCSHHAGKKAGVEDQSTKKCCENRTTIIKSDIDLFFSPLAFESAPVQHLTTAVFSFEIPLAIGKDKVEHIRDRAPPDPYAEPLYLVNESFLL